jgi:hypothetical protein
MAYIIQNVAIIICGAGVVMGGSISINPVGTGLVCLKIINLNCIFELNEKPELDAV